MAMGSLETPLPRVATERRRPRGGRSVRRASEPNVVPETGLGRTGGRQEEARGSHGKMRPEKFHVELASGGARSRISGRILAV